MDVSHIIDALNDAQREAVTAQNDHLLVLAGAGSGKTRVLVHRLAWLMQMDKVPRHCAPAAQGPLPGRWPAGELPGAG